MATGVQNFMWQWQEVHQSSLSMLLEKLLHANGLSAPFQAFLLGIPEEGDIGRIYTHPVESGFAPSDFKGVPFRAQELFDADPDQNLVFGAPHLHDRFHASLWPKALRSAALEVLNGHDEARGVVTFCGFPTKVNDHWVIGVVQLDRDAYAKVPRLRKSESPLNPRQFGPLSTSFMDAAIKRALEESAEEIESPSNGEDMFFADPNRVLEDAAESFMSGIGIRVNTWGTGDLIPLANDVASLRYEGASSKGRLVLARVDHSGCHVEVKLDPPISTRNPRALRKLLEVSNDDIALLCDGTQVWGLGHTSDAYNPDDEDLFEIQFVDHYTWELQHGGRSLLRVRYREPRLPGEKFNEDLFRDHLERLFPRADHALLREAVRAAVNQKKGTLLMISPQAGEEAARLSAQSTLLTPRVANASIVARLSAIDGALLLTPQGVLHAFGVILDGRASPNGDPSRGARYNSAIRYVESQRDEGTPALTVIVSEDGYVDLYPKLRPRIERGLVDQLLEELDEQAYTDKFDKDKSWSTLRSLDRVRFYLLPEDVERANKARTKAIERYSEAMQETLKGGMGFIHPPFEAFEADPEMNHDYYKPEKP